jgi:hypothetical protein
VKNALYGGKNHLYTLFICLSDYLLIGEILEGLKSILEGFEFLGFLRYPMDLALQKLQNGVILQL